MLQFDDERQLLQLLAKDSEYAFVVIFDRYKQRVYNSAFIFLKRADAAEEIVQEVFLKLWQSRKQLPEITYLNSYIKKIAYHLMVDQLRRTSLEKDYKKDLHSLGSTIDDTDHRVREDESLKILQAAIALLPQRQRQVYELSRIQGLSQEDIAASLSISKNTVKVHMSGALQSIRSYLKSQYPDSLQVLPFLILMTAVLESSSK